MINWTNLKIEAVLNITGRGTVLLTDLIVNDFTKDHWVTKIPIKVGHFITHNEKEYEIMGVESMSNTLDGKINHKVGLIVKENEGLG
jgi:hypothetical protein